ncbi:MAG TPA: FmdB family zinc ribbon protein [Burkholderiaceae bacterium]|nr:FmdB family zinc ribbon protein [Burkholderiaceae bacterium]
MPIYAYRCAACGHAKDVLQKVSDPVLTDCPACGASAFQKQVTAAGFQLKGSGWYVTDFRDGGSTAKASNGNGEAAKSDGAAKTDGGEKSDSAGSSTTTSGDSGGSAASPAPAPAASTSAPSAGAK